MTKFLQGQVNKRGLARVTFCVLKYFLPRWNLKVDQILDSCFEISFVFKAPASKTSYFFIREGLYLTFNLINVEMTIWSSCWVRSRIFGVLRNCMEVIGNLYRGQLEDGKSFLCPLNVIWNQLQPCIVWTIWRKFPFHA